MSSTKIDRGKASYSQRFYTSWLDYLGDTEVLQTSDNVTYQNILLSC